MPYQALRITRGIPGGEAAGSVLLEQDAWKPYTGFLTKAGAVAYLRSLLFGEPDDAPTENCGAAGGVDGNAATGTVYAYPDPPELAYQLHVSNGTLSGQMVEILPFSEIVQFQNSTEAALQYPTRTILAAEWLSKGEGLPEILTAGGRVRTKTPVLGSMMVVYEIVRHSREVSVAPRLGATQNSYQNFIYAVWDGGNAYLEYKPPPDAEEGTNGSHLLRCNSAWRSIADLLAALGLGTTPGGTDITLNPQGPPKAPSLGDIEKSWNYCENREELE